MCSAPQGLGLNERLCQTGTRPEWEYWDQLKRAPYIGWASSSWLIELHAVPQEQDKEGNFVDLEPYWMRLEELTRDDVIPTAIWDVLLDAVDDNAAPRMPSVVGQLPQRPCRQPGPAAGDID
jgi:hypothetical protein